MYHQRVGVTYIRDFTVDSIYNVILDGLAQLQLKP